MEILAEIDLEPEKQCNEYRIRRASRVILFNDKGAIHHEQRLDFYTLVGGGVEHGFINCKHAVKRDLIFIRKYLDRTAK